MRAFPDFQLERLETLCWSSQIKSESRIECLLMVRANGVIDPMRSFQYSHSTNGMCPIASELIPSMNMCATENMNHGRHGKDRRERLLDSGKHFRGGVERNHSWFSVCKCVGVGQRPAWRLGLTRRRGGRFFPVLFQARDFWHV